jgi:phage-related minor tail protein
MNDTEKAMLLAMVPILVRWIFVEIHRFSDRTKLGKALGGIEDAAQDAVLAVLPALTAQGASHAEIIKSATAAAKESVARDMPEIGQSLEAATVETLLAGHVAQAVTAPGGASVTMP